mgnify:CR=1 FL=1
MESRYIRQIQLSEIGVEGQEKLKSSRVLVDGAGGLGCPILLYLANSMMSCHFEELGYVPDIEGP